MFKPRPLVISAKKLAWRSADQHATESDQAFAKIREQILLRDQYRCQFCGFTSKRWQEVHHVDDDHANNKPSNLVTACPLCHQCHHIGFAGIVGGGIMIWLPEMTQVDLHHLCRAIFLATRDASDKYYGAASAIYSSLEARTQYLEEYIGPKASEPSFFAEVFMEMDDAQYARRGSTFPHLKLLPRPERFYRQIEAWRADAAQTLPVSSWTQVAGIRATR